MKSSGPDRDLRRLDSESAGVELSVGSLLPGPGINATRMGRSPALSLAGASGVFAPLPLTTVARGSRATHLAGRRRARRRRAAPGRGHREPSGVQVRDGRPSAFLTMPAR